MPTAMRPMPGQESSQVRNAQRARSNEGRGSAANPSAARRSRPRWSSTRYSITWSARASTDCGIVRPRALANGDHWNRACGIRSRQSPWRPPRHDQVNLQTNQLSREGRQPFVAAISRSVIDDEVLLLDIPKFAQTSSKAIEVGSIVRRRRSLEDADAIDLLRLRLDGERRKREAHSENDRKPDPPHGHLGGGWHAVTPNAASSARW
jgi:hypothetical protein